MHFNKITWFFYAVDYTLRKKSKLYKRLIPYARRKMTHNEEANRLLEQMILSGKPFAAARIGLFENAAMRMYEFGWNKKHVLVMNNIYNCAGFFPNDVSLGDRFNDLYKQSMRSIDILGSNKQLCENYFINKYMSKSAVVNESMGLYDVCHYKHCWTYALEGKKVLVVTPFTESVEQQYKKRERLFIGAEILPQFELKTYKSLMTVGDLRDERFADWFEALQHMEREILAIDFDIALLGCGAYGFPLAAAIKKAGRQVVHMGGSLQILFGIMGKRWDGTRVGDTIHIREDIAPYYNDDWTYPIEEKPKDASKVEYGPYWK